MQNLSAEQHEQLHRFYKEPIAACCKDHKFCPKSMPIRVRGIEDNYPLFPERRDMERKLAPASEDEQPIMLPGRFNYEPPVVKRPNLLVDFLRKDFPYRGIM